jgi:hypothetical protein
VITFYGGSVRAYWLKAAGGASKLLRDGLSFSGQIFFIMEARITFTNEQAQVEVYPQQQLVRLIWKGHAAGEAYRAPSLAVLSAVKDHHLKYFLSDARQMGPILFADRSWSEKEVIPSLIQAGLLRIAIVSSTDGLNVMAVDNMVNTIPMGTATVGFFDDPSIAQLWLLKDAGAEVPIPGNGSAERGG